MKKRILALIAAAIVSMSLLSGCQWSAKNFGGTYTINLEKGEKLDMVTWKDNDLWVLTRPMREDETPETYRFQEDSNLGIMEGTVNIIETK